MIIDPKSGFQIPTVFNEITNNIYSLELVTVASHTHPRLSHFMINVLSPGVLKICEWPLSFCRGKGKWASFFI